MFVGSHAQQPVKKGAQGMIVKRKRPYAIKKQRNGAGEIALGLHPAPKP